MPREPYRETYRVERRTRDLGAEERAVIDAHVRDWDERVRRQERAGMLTLLVPLVGSVAAVVFGALRGNGGVVFTGGVMTLVFALCFVGARRQSKVRTAASRGPWHAPPDGYRVIETHVFARSVVGAVSGDEDYEEWLLFEVPGGDWFYVDPTCLSAQNVDLARAELHLVRLTPHGPYLSVEPRGEAIPRHGALTDPDAYAKAVDDGQVWRPSLDEEYEAEGLVAEGDLPAWVRAAAGG